MAVSPSFRISRLSSGGLITNYLCSAACAHCSYRSSPRRDRAYITADCAAENMRVCRQLGCRDMHIGGGEPFLNPEGLQDVLRVARQEKMSISYVETNSSWFKDLPSAIALLRELLGLGCTCLLVSIDPFHNAHVPFYKVKGVLQACRSAGMDVFPWIMDFYGDLDYFDDQKRHSLEEYEKAFGDDYLSQVRRRYGVSMCGRALDTFGHLRPRFPLETVLAESTACRRLTQTGHFHIDLYGKYTPPSCVGLSLAREDLGREVSIDTYPAFAALLVGGVSALFGMAQEYGFVPAEAYADGCELCADIRRHLSVEVPEAFPDLSPREFYTTA